MDIKGCHFAHSVIFSQIDSFSEALFDQNRKRNFSEIHAGHFSRGVGLQKTCLAVFPAVVMSVPPMSDCFLAVLSWVL